MCQYETIMCVILKQGARKMDLKKIREDKNLTQDELSRKIGLSRCSYTNIENGIRKPSVDVAKRIGKELGFPWIMLFDESEGA